MALHLNSEALKERGWKLNAKYECFEKGMPCLYIECWENHGAYLVRDWNRGRPLWDHVFRNRDKANNRVIALWSLRKWHKRVV